MKTTIQARTTILLLLIFGIFQTHAKAENSSFSLHCPNDVWADCTDELWDLSVYGNAYYHDYDGDHDAGNPEVSWHLNDCNTGYIKRTWSVQDPYNGDILTCHQTIYVEGSDSFDESNIHWPETGLQVEGCNPNTHPSALPEGYGYPTWDNLACAKPAYSFKDKIFVFSATCKKIIREWTVIDCCQFDPNDGEGIWKRYQAIDVTDANVPVISCGPEVTVSSYNCSDAFVDLSDALSIEAGNCGSEDYEVINTSPFAANDGADASGIYPIGETTFKYKVKYGCDYWKQCTITVIVENNTTPVPYCYYGLSIALMGMDTDLDGINDEGMVEIWASDFDKGSYHSCPENGPLTFSFSSDVTDQFRVFTCDEVGKNEIEMWVTDKFGNQNFCNTYVNVQNNAANIEDCEEEEESMWRLIGNFTDLDGERRESVEVNLSSDILQTNIVEHTEMELTLIDVDTFVNQSGVTIIREWFDTTYITTIDTIIEPLFIERSSNDDGNIFIYDVPTNEDFEFRMNFSSDHSKYITEEDLDALYKHLTGEAVFDSPYYLIAADLDDSGTVDMDDLKLLSKMVAGKIDSFPTIRNWVVIEKDYGFKFPNNPFFEIQYFDPQSFRNVKEDIIKDYYTIKRGNLVFTDEEVEKPTKNLLKTVDQYVEINADKKPVLTELILSPNPAKDVVRISLTVDDSQSLQIQLMDQNSKVVMTQNRLLDSGENAIELELDNSIVSGVYYYTVNGKTINATGRLVVIK